jgi:hypothetical protein
MKEESPFRSMASRWPSTVVARSEIPAFTGGMMSEKYISNLDSSGDGPANVIKCGKKIVYPINDLITWLEKRSSPRGSGNPVPGIRPRGLRRIAQKSILPVRDDGHVPVTSFGKIAISRPE